MTSYIRGADVVLSQKQTSWSSFKQPSSATKPSKTTLPKTPEQRKGGKSRFSLGRLLRTPSKKNDSPQQRVYRTVDEDSVSSEDIYLTEEEMAQSNTVTLCLNDEYPASFEAIKKALSSPDLDSDPVPVFSPCSSTSSSTASTLSSRKMALWAKEKSPSRDASVTTTEDDPVNYWKNILRNRVSHYGANDVKTAEAYMGLGNSQLLDDRNHDAGKSFLSALKIYQSIYGDSHLGVARALDKLGQAACKTNENLDLAVVALSDAFKIRCDLLGPTHVDSIDTLNNIANVRLNMKYFDLAALDYLAVFRRRAKVFGKNHVSVAVTSYILGCILQDHLGLERDAEEFFMTALHIYTTVGARDSTDIATIRRRLGLKDGQTIGFDGYLFIDLRVERLERTLQQKLRKSCPVEI